MTEGGSGTRNRAAGDVGAGHPPAPTVYGQPMKVVVLLLLLLLFPTQGMSQSLRSTEKTRAPEKPAPVPKKYLPPAGMCRVWVDNVPAARQPAPTDCATAIRNRPPNARVIFPDRREARPAQPKVPAPNRPRADTTRRKPPA